MYSMISSMSQTSHTFDQNNSHKRATIANVYASTPIKASVKRIHSISLSEIDTASSSSGSRIKINLLFLLQDQTKKRKRYTKEKKRANKPWRIKTSDSERETEQKLINESLNEKRKKILKKKKTVKRKRIVTEPEDTEWETKSEKSINELATGLQGFIPKDNECMNIKLFEDPCTPEKTRDVPSAYEEILCESPIIRFSKRSRLISKKNDVILQNELLPVNLLSPELRNPKEISEDKIIFHKGNAKNKYVPLRKPEKNPKEKPESFPIKIPTTTNSLHRDQSIETYPKKTSRHLPSPSVQTPIQLDFMQKLSDPWEIENTLIPPGMACVTGYWNKVLRKWVTYRDSSAEKELENGKRETKTSKRNTRKQKKKL